MIYRYKSLRFFAAVVAFFICTGTFAQEIDTENTTNQKLADAQLAMSVPDYPVTPGDVYQLTFLAGSQAVAYTVIVDSSYRIRIANLGVISCADLTYPQLKAQVEQVVIRNYPMSGAQLVMTSPALFFVNITGEVNAASVQMAWALSRLRNFIRPHLTAYSSSRNVTVVSANGERKTYDLFKAMRDGDFSQDPYLRSGDNIIINRIERRVSIGGAVERPGSYELLEGEQLKTLIEKYAGGLKPLADTSRITLTRTLEPQNRGTHQLLDESVMETDFSLLCYDAVTIPSFEELQNAVFIEGAIRVGTVSDELEGGTRMYLRFKSGTDYASMLRAHADIFSPSSDLANCYIKRNDERIPIDVNKILYDPQDYRAERMVNGDVLVVPFKQFFVSVSGAVYNPGRFPYIPDRDWQYYVGLAGGIDEFKNSRKKITIRNADGKITSKDEFISPEATIIVASNSAWYKWNSVSGGVATIASVIATTLSIILTTQTLSK